MTLAYTQHTRPNLTLTVILNLYPNPNPNLHLSPIPNRNRNPNPKNVGCAGYSGVMPNFEFDTEGLRA